MLRAEKHKETREHASFLFPFCLSFFASLHLKHTKQGVRYDLTFSGHATCTQKCPQNRVF